MGLLTFLKRPSSADPPDLRTQLVTLVVRKDLNGLARLVRERRETIAAGFADWLTVPGAMQEDPVLLEHYGEMLLAVARIVDHDGDGQLLKMLEGDPADAPVELWNEQIAIAASLSEHGRFAEATRVLTALAARIDTLRGSAVDFYRPRVLGKLGIALYQAGDTAGAHDATRQARDLCRRLGDEDGVQAYETNLANMGGDGSSNF
jgi:hypothetical protein